MRVLFVNENIGGHTTTHVHLRRALADRSDVDVRFLDVPRPGLARRVVGAPVPGLAGLDIDMAPLRQQLAASAWTRRHLPALLADVDAIHVFTHNAVLLSAGALAAIPSVVALDNTNAMNAYALPYRDPGRFTPSTVAATKVFERRVHAAADLLVATSATAATSLREQYGVAESRIRRVHYGIYAPAFDPPAAPGTRAATPVLVFVGFSMARKGGTQLLRVHQERFRSRCTLVLVTTEPVGPQPGVVVVDDLAPGDDRLWEVLRAGAVFVFPSRIDHQPNVVMEAMAVGLPVIAHPIHSIIDMVDDGVTGWHLRDPSDDALAAAIECALADPARLAAMGAAGRVRFDDRFAAATTVTRVLDVLAEAVTRHRTGAPG